jgi:hypothetical protein
MRLLPKRTKQSSNLLDFLGRCPEYLESMDRAADRAWIGVAEFRATASYSAVAGFDSPWASVDRGTYAHDPAVGGGASGRGIKLTSVASTILGKTGRAILAALLAGQDDPAVLAELAKGLVAPQDPGAAGGVDSSLSR